MGNWKIRETGRPVAAVAPTPRPWWHKVLAWVVGMTAGTLLLLGALKGCAVVVVSG